MPDKPTENPHPTEMDKKQDAEREQKGTGDAKLEPGQEGEVHDASTFTDQGKPV